MPFKFAPTGAAKIEGQPSFPSVYDPIRRVVLSDNPDLPGLDLAGRVKNTNSIFTAPFNQTVSTSAILPSSPTSGTVANKTPGADLPPLFSAPASPRVSVAPGSAPLPSPVFPGTVPQSPGVSRISVPRSENVSGATGSLFNELETVKGTVGKAVADFKARFPEFLSGQEATADAERAATQQLFDGGERARINDLLANFEAKANAANAKSIADTQNLRSRQMIAQGGGRSSAFDRLQFDKIAEINARAAAQSADRALSSNQFLAQLQQQMAGAQANRDRQAIADTLLPATVDSNAFQSILQQLAVLSPIEQQNLLTGLVAPGGFIGDSFGQLQSAKLQDLARLDAAARGDASLGLQARNQAFNEDFFTNQARQQGAQSNVVAQPIASPDVDDRNWFRGNALTG